MQSGLVVAAVVVASAVVVVPPADSGASSSAQPGTTSASPTPPSQPSARLRVTRGFSACDMAAACQSFLRIAYELMRSVPSSSSASIEAMIVNTTAVTGTAR